MGLEENKVVEEFGIPWAWGHVSLSIWNFQSQKRGWEGGDATHGMVWIVSEITQ